MVRKVFDLNCNELGEVSPFSQESPFLWIKTKRILLIVISNREMLEEVQKQHLAAFSAKILARKVKAFVIDETVCFLRLIYKNK